MAELSTDRIREIESRATGWLQRRDVPGVSVVLVDEDGERYAEGFGARNVEENAPATPDTLYGMASITKSMTALGVLQLAEDGQLELDDVVDSYVDHFRGVPGDPITIEALLSHRSGMPATRAEHLRQVFEGHPAGVADEDDNKRMIREAFDHRVTDESRFFYYNTGYGVLGKIIEAVDGRQFHEYVTEEILEPLGMDRATFRRESVEADEDVMTGYLRRDGSLEPEPFPFVELIDPSGGLVASVRELSRYLRAMMTDGSLDGVRVCAPGTVQRLQRGRVVFRESVDGDEFRYGYGWSRQPLLGEQLVGHSGDLLNSSSFMGFLNETGLGVVVAANTGHETTPKQLAEVVLAIATGHEPTDVPGYALREKCERVSGRYESFDGQITATVERDGGMLSIELSEWIGESELAAYPASLAPDDYEFYNVRESGWRYPIEFDVEGDEDDLFIARNRFRRADSTREG